MFKIGEFSKMVQVPVPTLRYYDQMGLLRPIRVDQVTGYRYYSASQLPRLHRILALRGLGFSLEQIGEILAEGLTAEQMRGMLRLRHAQIRQELAAVQGQLTEVEARIRQIEREATMSAYDVVLKQVQPLLIASVRTILPIHNALTPIYGEVFEGLGPNVDEVLGSNWCDGASTVAIWYDEEYKEHNVDGAAGFILRKRIPESGRVKVHELPAATMAATVHHGSYNTLIEAHEAILQWIEANCYSITGPSRELYLYNPHPIDHDNPAYITEVQFPVEKTV